MNGQSCSQGPENPKISPKMFLFMMNECVQWGGERMDIDYNECLMKFEKLSHVLTWNAFTKPAQKYIWAFVFR
jgi:hypothetical protein